MKKTFLAVIFVLALLLSACAPDYTDEYNSLYDDYEDAYDEWESAADEYAGSDIPENLGSVYAIDDYAAEFEGLSESSIEFCMDAMDELDGYSEGISEDDYDSLYEELEDFAADVEETNNEFLFNKYYAILFQVNKDIVTAKDSHAGEDTVKGLEMTCDDLDELYDFMADIEGGIKSLAKDYDAGTIEDDYEMVIKNLKEEKEYYEIAYEFFALEEQWSNSMNELSEAANKDSDTFYEAAQATIDLAKEIDPQLYDLSVLAAEQRDNLSSLNAEARKGKYDSIILAIETLMGSTSEFASYELE